MIISTTKLLRIRRSLENSEYYTMKRNIQNQAIKLYSSFCNYGGGQVEMEAEAPTPLCK